MTIITDTRFRDVRDREERAYDEINNTIDRLATVAKKRALNKWKTPS